MTIKITKRTDPGISPDQRVVAGDTFEDEDGDLWIKLCPGHGWILIRGDVPCPELYGGEPRERHRLSPVNLEITVRRRDGV